MKRIMILALAAVVAYGLSGCGTVGSERGSEEDASAGRVGRVAIDVMVSRGSVRVDHVGTPRDMFAAGTAAHWRMVSGTGYAIMSLGSYPALVGAPVMVSAFSAPVTGVVRSVSSLAGQVPEEQEESLKRIMGEERWLHEFSDCARAAAASAGWKVMRARPVAGDPSGCGREGRLAAAREAGAEVLAEVVVYGPQLARSGEYKNGMFAAVAVRVSVVRVASGVEERVFWVRREGRERHLPVSWAGRPEELEGELARVVADAAEECGERLGGSGGRGEVVRTYRLRD